MDTAPIATAASPSTTLLARVVIVGAVGAVEQLTYAIPAALIDRLTPGHRVLVPLRTRRVTAIVLEISAELDHGGVAPKPIIELLEPRALFDRPHRDLIDFVAAYYMTSLGAAYRNVMPATARVESRRLFHPGTTPSPMAQLTFTPLESTLLAALAKRPMTMRQLQKLGDGPPLAAAMRRLTEDRYVEERDGTHGRHREVLARNVRLMPDAGGLKLRGPRQRAIVQSLAEAGPAGLSPDQLETIAPNAKGILRGLLQKRLVELTAAPPSVIGDTRAAAMMTMTPAPFDPSWEQTAAIDEIAPVVRDHRFATFLLWGVTGSGKTEVYVRLAAEALAAGRQALVLVPEIALADQVVRAFRDRFGAIAAVVHSAQNVTERWSGWMAALSGASRVIIGPRSAIFAPLHDLGLIVVDEEHDSAYKQGEGIRYHARDLAVALGRMASCPVILGSATPSAESFNNARRGRYRLVRLERRVGSRDLATVEIIDMRQQLPPSAPATATTDPAPVPLSPLLIEALRNNLANGGQSLVFLNRRGYHNFLQCHLCGNVIACVNCSVSLTFHLRDRSLRCHYCGASDAAPEKCAECGGLGLEGQGFGTERLTHALADLLPDARIERMDGDTSGRGGQRSAIVAGLREGSIDIVVGTQMIAKGFNFPGVTLVGVVLADLTLNIPDFRSAERTFQLLTQVAGRAGRGDSPGRVLIQTYAPHHYSVRAARDQDFARFIRRELELRRELGYPPFARMALVRIEGADSSRVATVAGQVAAFLGRFAAPDRMRVLGPAPAPIERIKQRYRWQVLVKSPQLNELRAALAAMRASIIDDAAPAGVHVAIDIDPVNML